MAENDLAKESSPYLLQHASNPVKWHAWNDESLQRAKNENKPIFLSIGYSSCHWCHVMAHESFENKEIADIMNENFVNIKVDREERPDIDDVYQKACQLATGQGGWPLSAFLTPDQKPFYVGTYFPILDSYGRPGFGSILNLLAQTWKEESNDIKQSAEKFLVKMQKMQDRQETSSIPERQVLDEAAVNLLQMGDSTYGGFGTAPKFPSTACVSFLLRYTRLSGISGFEKFALKTLNRMARGGMFDQIGGGFHRYSTDARWLVPHFEKMLYDNALIPASYAEAYQITGDQFYLQVMTKTLDYILREMTSQDGGFYSSQDADSDGDEGRFYVWSKREITDVLGEGKKTDAFCTYYDVTSGGNWEGNTILCNNISLSTVAFKCNMTEDETRSALYEGAKKLLERRASRVPPGRDEKILTSWNALMITAFAYGFRVSGDARYIDAAKDAVEFIESHMLDKDRLLHSYKGKARIPGCLEDYTYYANALLDVFESDPESRLLDRATALGSQIIERFWDHGGFFMTANDSEQLIIRPKSDYDLSMPSGSSVAAHLFIRLFYLTQEKKFLNVSLEIIKSHSRQAAENPFGFGHLLNAMYLHVYGHTEITIVNDSDKNITNSLYRRFLLEASIITIKSKAQLDELSKYAAFAGKTYKDSTTVFVCRDFACSAPLTSISEIEKHIAGSVKK